MGLQNKIFIYAGVSLLALMSLLTWISLQTNSQSSEIVRRERLAFAENIAFSIDGIIRQQPDKASDITYVNDVISTYLQLQASSYNIELVTTNGLILAASYTGTTPNYSSHRESIRLLAQQRITGIVEEQKGSQDKHLVTFVPLTTHPDWGVIIEKTQDEDIVLPWMGGRPLLVTGLVILLAGGLMWMVTRQIVTPLKRLAATAQRFGTGDLDAPIPVTGRDEIGELAGNLDTMRLQLKHSLDEIVELNRELEQRVKQRTHELEELERQLREQNKEKGDLLGKIITTQEEERKRIARELHDEVGQSITSLMIGFKVLETQDPEKMSQGIDQLKKLSAQTLEDVRHLALELRPSSLDDLGLIAALRQYTREYKEKTGVNAEFQTSGFEGKRLQPEVEIALYRIVQEALTNVARHAEAKKVSVLMGIRNSSIVAIVEDDGKGFDVQDVISSKNRERRLGLYGMQERASLIGGVLTIEANPGKGTTIFVEVPLKGDEGK